jgi:hypothetical protein
LIASQFHNGVLFQDVVDNQMFILRTDHGLYEITSIAQDDSISVLNSPFGLGGHRLDMEALESSIVLGVLAIQAKERSIPLDFGWTTDMEFTYGMAPSVNGLDCIAT